MIHYELYWLQKSYIKVLDINYILIYRRDKIGHRYVNQCKYIVISLKMRIRCQFDAYMGSGGHFMQFYF